MQRRQYRRGQTVMSGARRAGQGSDEMRGRVRILIAALATATTAAVAAPHAAHADLSNCRGYGGQGAGGFVSSLVQNCTSGIVTH
jgi:hypothetical protein